MGVDTQTIEDTHTLVATLGFVLGKHNSLAKSLHTTSFIGAAHTVETTKVAVVKILAFEYIITPQNFKKLVNLEKRF